MNYDLQTAGMWKRISAALLDGILLVVLITGAFFVLGELFHYNEHSQTMADIYDRYAAEYGISFDITEEELAALPVDKLAIYEAAANAMNKDEEAIYVYNMIINISMAIITLGTLIAYVVLELVVPLIFGNGQTLGKKVFGLAVMRTDGVKIKNTQLFIRAILGKYTVETMVPLLLLLMMSTGSIGMFGPILLLFYAAVQLGLLIFNRNRACIHDYLSATVVVDYASQMIYETYEDLLKHQQQVAAEKADRADY